MRAEPRRQFQGNTRQRQVAPQPTPRQQIDRRNAQQQQQREQLQRRNAEQQRLQLERRNALTKQREQQQQRQAVPTPKDQPRTTERDRRNDTRPQQASRIQATPEQRRGVRDRLFKERVQRDRLNVAVHIGSRIPRRHRLHRFPRSVIAFFPAYAAYSYLVADDDIYVVEPASYEVVDIISASSLQAGRPPAPPPGLALSPEEKRFVYEAVPKDTRVDIRLRLALGVEIPPAVALLPFPERVLARIPVLGNYAFVVVGDDVAIVNPADRSVALVLPD
jgi:hypothetical protein